MHLFLHGPSGAGKSTLLWQALQAQNLRPYGLKTKKIPAEEPAEARICIVGAGYQGDYRELGRESTVGLCGAYGIKESFPEIFESKGIAFLSDIPAGATVLLDELGFAESDAPGFQAKVLSLLDGPYRIIGVIKEKSTPFLDQIRNHPLVRCQEVSVKSRSQTARLLAAFLRMPTLDQALGLTLGLTFRKKIDASSSIIDDFSRVPSAGGDFDGSAARGKVISLVGGGGKTTTMYLLANELAAKGARVIVTTTTHIRPPQSPLVKETLCFSPDQSSQGVAEIRQALTKHSPLGLIGFPANGKAGPVSKDLFHRLPEAADFIITEADGSRGLPLKAPAAHEPVIPEESSLVVAVAGLSGLGKPLAQVCHRPELASLLLNCPPEKSVSADDLCRLLLSAKGLAKNKPPSAGFALLLNQADALADRGCLELLAQRLKSGCPGPETVRPERLLICALQTSLPLWRYAAFPC